MRFITYTILFSIFFYSCQDNCDYYSTYIKYNPIYSNMDKLRDTVSDLLREEFEVTSNIPREMKMMLTGNNVN